MGSSGDKLQGNNPVAMRNDYRQAGGGAQWWMPNKDGDSRAACERESDLQSVLPTQLISYCEQPT